MKSGSPSVKVIFILCRYLPFIIGATRIPSEISRFLHKQIAHAYYYPKSVDVVGAGVNDDMVMCRIGCVSSPANQYLGVPDITSL